MIVKLDHFPRYRGENKEYLKPPPSYSLPSFFTQFAVRFQGGEIVFLGSVGVQKFEDTLDGRNPAPVDMVNIPLFSWFYTSQVVQDFFHQQFNSITKSFISNFWFAYRI